MSKLKIKKNKEKIVLLLNQNIDLAYKLRLKGYKKTFEKEVNLGTKKEPKIIIATFGMWLEDFVDEDNGEVVSIERNEVIAVDGKPSNGYRVINYYSIDDI
ncbi:hypothetical protein K5L04_09385 [Flavobacterium psychrophilum]|uniref:hypothetical protein n=1 Tax=Flavobacterium psychrophilum TaxID=96345 RepID=UPI000B7C3232|nr:hypothetical protein [Flavobacterium psychrophilum]QCW20037.1 hypothetical protein [Flavobacterium phage FPSV-D15]QCW20773.1 hypothetical protein [Flavobacterium phage FPSV-D35]EKT4497724.1 hypothetical protein [Flavobacterium psychrophilum]EKT4500960.1 hypothetical protein [Flavobacterium psychrophilum]EKT4502335.1 hypothetical protein [Flavobacterium psychrophilum]